MHLDATKRAGLLCKNVRERGFCPVCRQLGQTPKSKNMKCRCDVRYATVRVNALG
jgi:hypothetical protein